MKQAAGSPSNPHTSEAQVELLDDGAALLVYGVTGVEDTDSVFMWAKVGRKNGSTVSAHRDVPASPQPGIVFHYQVTIDKDGPKLGLYYETRP